MTRNNFSDKQNKIIFKVVAIFMVCSVLFILLLQRNEINQFFNKNPTIKKSVQVQSRQVFQVNSNADLFDSLIIENLGK